MGSREVLNIDTAAPLCSEHSALLTARLLAPMATCRHMQIQQIRLYRRSSVPHVESQKRTRTKQKKSITWSTQTLIRKYKKQKHVTTRRNHATEENSSPIQLRVWLKQNILERAACIMVSNYMDSCFTVRTWPEFTPWIWRAITLSDTAARHVLPNMSGVIS